MTVRALQKALLRRGKPSAAVHLADAEALKTVVAEEGLNPKARKEYLQRTVVLEGMTAANLALSARRSSIHVDPEDDEE